MDEPRLSSLHRVFQKLGLDEVIPHLTHASDHDLHAPFAKFLFFSECHEDVNIPGKGFNPTSLPEIAYSEVRDSIEDRLLGDRRSPLMIPHFSTMNKREIQTLGSQEPSAIVRLTEPPLDTDDFLGCRVFFRVVAEAVEQGIRTVTLKEEEHRIAMVVHIKALRWLKAKAGSAFSGDKETVLFQVEYMFMEKEVAHRDKTEKIFSDLLQQQPKSTVRFCSGTKHQVHFVCQVLQAHERLLSKSVISEHDKLWKPRQKFIRPSFIVPLRNFCECDVRQGFLQEIGATVVSPASDACAVCRKVDVKLKACTGCKSINYCGRECQAVDWRFHKPTCRAMRIEERSQVTQR